MKSVSYQSDRLVYTERDTDSPWYGRHYHLDLRFVRSDRLRQELKAYVWHHYRYRLKQPSTLRQEICWMRYYENWLYDRAIGSLTGITRSDAEGFVSFLHICVSKKTGRPLSILSQKHIYQTIVGIYRWYACRKQTYVRPLLLFPADVYPGMRGVQKEAAVDWRQVNQVMDTLDRQKNECLRAGSRFILMTGMTPGDLLTLHVDALKMTENGYYVRCYHHRTRTYRMIPVSPQDADAWLRLRVYTDALRADAPAGCRTRLFLYRDRSGGVRPASPDQFRYWLRQAQERQQEACNGEQTPIPVTCTMLREFLLCSMREQRIPPAVIRELTGCGLYAEGRRVL